MKTFKKSIAAAAVATIALIGTGACTAPQEEQAVSVSTPAALEERTAPKAVETIKSFFAAATTKEIATADPAKAGPELFDKALEHVDPEAPAGPLTAALSDLAVLKVTSPSSALTVEVNQDKVVIDGDKATVPVAHVAIKSAGVKVAKSDELADQINDLVFRDGSWVIAFPSASK